MQYLARWRMQVASGLLAGSSEGLAAIADAVGYGSEAAFNRAFKKVVGVPPATWRRRRPPASGLGPRVEARGGRRDGLKPEA
jgi:AraC-like DNA-binding protein